MLYILPFPMHAINAAQHGAISFLFGDLMYSYLKYCSDCLHKMLKTFYWGAFGDLQILIRKICRGFTLKDSHWCYYLLKGWWFEKFTSIPSLNKVWIICFYRIFNTKKKKGTTHPKSPSSLLRGLEGPRCREWQSSLTSLLLVAVNNSKSRKNIPSKKFLKAIQIGWTKKKYKKYSWDGQSERNDEWWMKIKV